MSSSSPTPTPVPAATDPVDAPRAATTAVGPSPTPDAAAMPRSGLFAGRRVTAVLLVLAPVAEIVEAAISPLTDGTTAQDLAAIAAHQQAFVVSVMIGLLGTLLYIPAFVGLLEICRVRSPRWSRLGAWLMVTSISCFVGVRATQPIELELALSTLGPDQAAAILDRGFSSTPMGIVIFGCFLGGAFLGLIAIAVACWRGGLPRVAAVIIAVFQIVDLMASNHWGTVVSHTVLLVGLGWMAVTLWRGTLRAPRTHGSSLVGTPAAVYDVNR